LNDRVIRSAAPMRIGIFQARPMITSRGAFRAGEKLFASHFRAAFADQVRAIGKFPSDFFDDPFELGAVSCSMGRCAWLHKPFCSGGTRPLSHFTFAWDLARRVFHSILCGFFHDTSTVFFAANLAQKISHATTGIWNHWPLWFMCNE
jgi:hypothetical protein